MQLSAFHWSGRHSCMFPLVNRVLWCIARQTNLFSGSDDWNRHTRKWYCSWLGNMRPIFLWWCCICCALRLWFLLILGHRPSPDRGNTVECSLDTDRVHQIGPMRVGTDWSNVFTLPICLAWPSRMVEGPATILIPSFDQSHSWHHVVFAFGLRVHEHCLRVTVLLTSDYTKTDSTKNWTCGNCTTRGRLTTNNH